MAVTLTTAARNAACNGVVDLLDAGAGAGTLIFQTSGDVEVATCTFSDPAFGAAASGKATASAITDDTNATGGTIAKARFKDSNAVEILSCTVGTSGADINFTSVVIAATETVSMTSLTLTQPAT